MQYFVKSSQVVQKMSVGNRTHPQHDDLKGLLLGACWGVLLKSVKTLNFRLKSYWNNGWFRWRYTHPCMHLLTKFAIYLLKETVYWTKIVGRIILKWVFKKWYRRSWTGLLWFRIGTGGRCLLAQWRTFGFNKMRGISCVAGDMLAAQKGLCSLGLVMWVLIFQNFCFQQSTLFFSACVRITKGSLYC